MIIRELDKTPETKKYCAPHLCALCESIYDFCVCSQDESTAVFCDDCHLAYQLPNIGASPGKGFIDWYSPGSWKDKITEEEAAKLFEAAKVQYGLTRNS